MIPGEFSVNRAETFSDAVLAFATPFLVLEIKMPQIQSPLSKAEGIFISADLLGPAGQG
jgi:uncharacterized membrane protein